MAMQTLQQTFFDWWNVLNNAVAAILPRSRFGTAANEDAAEPGIVNRGEGELPFGVDYLVTVMDVIVPLPFPSKELFTL